MTRTPERKPPEYQLRGADVTDRAGCYAAIGAALNGPGGYYGANLDALADCLRGGFGPAAPFTLVWHDAAVARRWLTSRLEVAGRDLSYYEAVLDTLRAGGVTVVER
ncbi:barstar family protein [Kitasatospora sp. NBC_00315]|uniref:barstar family protein n=1 Tax=Kitasatospora sp. NBC_00315 TaxID=2975963 RepID=UPI003253C73F